MNRTNFFFRQVVTEAEMDLSFDQVEQGLQDYVTDFETVGITSGGDLAEVGTPNLTVDVSTPLIARDQLGNRIYSASIDPVDVSVDSNAISTDVSGPGKEKYVSIFIQYDILLSDERIDGNSNSVYWLESESYTIIVVQGAEYDTGLAIPTALLPDALLLGDVLRYDGQTEVLNADIDLSRQEVAFALSTASFDIAAGTLKESAQGILQALEDHIAEVGVAHNASAIVFDPAGTAHVGATVQAALAETGVLAGTNDWSGVGVGVFNRFLESAIEFYSQDSDALSWGPSNVRIRTYQFEGTVPASPWIVAHTFTSKGAASPYLMTGHPSTGLFNFIVEGVIAMSTGNSLAAILAWSSFRYHFVVTRSAGSWAIGGVGASPDTNIFSGGAGPMVSLVVNGLELDFRITSGAAEEGANYRVFTMIKSFEIPMAV